MTWREGMLRVHGASLSAWCDRHGVEPFEAPCNACGVTLRADTPFAWRAWRGLTAPTCACGNTDVPFCIGEVLGG